MRGWVVHRPSKYPSISGQIKTRGGSFRSLRTNGDRQSPHPFGAIHNLQTRMDGPAELLQTMGHGSSQLASRSGTAGNNPNALVTSHLEYTSQAGPTHPDTALRQACSESPNQTANAHSSSSPPNPMGRPRPYPTIRATPESPFARSQYWMHAQCRKKCRIIGVLLAHDCGWPGTAPRLEMTRAGIQPGSFVGHRRVEPMPDARRPMSAPGHNDPFLPPGLQPDLWPCCEAFDRLFAPPLSTQLTALHFLMAPCLGPSK